LSESTLQTLEDFVCPGATWLKGATRRTRGYYQITNGSSFILCGLEDIERIKSMELDFIIVDEATEIEENDWEILLSRLSGRFAPYRQAIAICNPGAPSHWLKLRADKGQMTHIHGSFSDNPVLDADVLKTLSSLTGVRRLRLYDGVWASSEGIVFDLSEAIIQHEKPPPGENYAGMDFGFSAPTGIVLGRLYTDESMRDVIYVYDERCVAECPVEVHAQWILAHGGTDCVVYADPEAPDAIRELQKNDVCAVKATNAVLYGIDRVNSFLAGKRLFISDKCKELIKCCAAYVYDKDGVKPKKVGDHMADGLRYLVASAGRNLDAETTKTG